MEYTAQYMVDRHKALIAYWAQGDEEADVEGDAGAEGGYA